MILIGEVGPCSKAVRRRCQARILQVSIFSLSSLCALSLSLCTLLTPCAPIFSHVSAECEPQSFSSRNTTCLPAPNLSTTSPEKSNREMKIAEAETSGGWMIVKRDLCSLIGRESGKMP